ncbi:hypothetical protein [Streptomyces sp. NPDC003077]|uniref:hypothetical protein n=1 Tax=Streptomyces sp. NPDC003077 TaxID=3154443 RepID=UPI0033A9FB7A
MARAAVCRRWPCEDLFLGDLLKEIARSAPAAAGADGRAGEEAVLGLARARIEEFATAEGRRALCVGLLRQGACGTSRPCTPRRGGAPASSCAPPSSVWPRTVAGARSSRLWPPPNAP